MPAVIGLAATAPRKRPVTGGDKVRKSALSLPCMAEQRAMLPACSHDVAFLALPQRPSGYSPNAARIFDGISTCQFSCCFTFLTKPSLDRGPLILIHRNNHPAARSHFCQSAPGFRQGPRPCRLLALSTLPCPDCSRCTVQQPTQRTQQTSRTGQTRCTVL